MPIYEYQCPFCHQELEVLQKMNEAPPTHCPHCHKEGLRRLVSAAGFQLKGTGWYATDYGNKGKPKDELKAEDKSKSSAEKATDTTKDPKTESKTEAKTGTKTEKPKDNKSSTKSES
jgi:putative FmdB family regulatory protein